MANIVTLSEAASIALHGVIIVALSDNKANVQQIADLTNSSRHHVAKIFQRLVKDGYLASFRGPQGGFSLKKDPADITLLEIYESIEGKIEIRSCPHGKEKCPFEKCILENVTRQMTIDFKNHLQRSSIADFM